MEENESNSLTLGARFGEYQIAGFLGRGAFGEVYKAMKLSPEVPRALKILHESYSNLHEVVTRFHREARIVARLNHPHIVQIHEYGTHEGRLFMAMEFLEGESLAARLERVGQMPPTEVVDLMLPLIDALENIHKAGVVHRDLKPENLIIVKKMGLFEIKLIDFGVARAPVRESNAGGTRGPLGTPHYMSPEQVQDARRVDARSDQWSLGVILYECVSGQVPFNEQKFYDLCEKILKGTLIPVRALNPNVPPAYDGAVTRALSKGPEDRFASMAELGRALFPLASQRAQSNFRHLFGAQYEDDVATKVRELGSRELSSVVPRNPRKGDAPLPAAPPDDEELVTEVRVAPSAPEPEKAPGGDYDDAVTKAREDPKPPTEGELRAGPPPRTISGTWAPLTPPPESEPRGLWGVVALGLVALLLAGVAVSRFYARGNLVLTHVIALSPGGGVRARPHDATILEQGSHGPVVEPRAGEGSVADAASGVSE